MLLRSNYKQNVMLSCLLVCRIARICFFIRMPIMSDKSLWESCLHSFEETLPPQQFNSWIKPLICEINGDRITLTAPNTFILKVIQDRFLPEISKLAKLYLKNTPQFELKIGKKLVAITTPKLIPVEIIEQAQVKIQRNHSKLNEALSFENFVTGKADSQRFEKGNARRSFSRGFVLSFERHSDLHSTFA